MKDILFEIKKKKSDFASLPFFDYLKNSSLDPLQRLSFAPCAAPFIMSFADLNKYVLREEPTTNKIQELINQHSYEDDHHWQWFLEDIDKLGFNTSQSFVDTLSFLWSNDTIAPRKICLDLYRLTYEASPELKLVIVETIEATGSVFLSSAQRVAQELKELTQKDYRYFGAHHFSIDSNHSIVSDEHENFVENITLSIDQKKLAFEIVNKIFEVFTEFTEELLRFSQLPGTYESLLRLPSHEYEYLIIGAGPAGLQLGYYLEKSKHDYAILEAGSAPGTFFKEYPRHRKLISINKLHTGYDDPEINLRWDWNSLLSDSEEMLFKHYSKKYFPDADNFVDYLGDFANHFDLNIKYEVKVTKITKDQKFIISDQNGKVYICKNLVVATGCSKLYLPDIPGIELAEKYTKVSINPDDFENQRVLIIGKGNSAFETADNLIDTTATIHVCSPNPVTMAWRTKYVGHLRAVNNNFLDTYQLKSQNAILDANIKNIDYRDGEYVVSVNYSHANEESEDLIYDRVILCTGFRFDTSIFDEGCKPELTINDRFPAQTSEWESTNIQDLYFAGILMHMRDFKKKQSGFIHGFRYNIRTLHRILATKYHQKSLPFQKVALSPEKLTQFIIDRVNTSSSLWQQTDYMCDLITISEDSREAHYYDELTKDYIHEGQLGQHSHYYTVSLEFGENVADIVDPFAIERVHKEDAFNSSSSEFIHPVIRRFCGSTLIAEHHVIEDLASEWKEDVHIQPLQQFFTDQLVQPRPIGSHLLDAGLLTSEQLEAALAEQEIQASIRLGEVLKNRGWVKERTIQFMLDNVINNSSDRQELETHALLGAYLVEAGLVTQEQVDQALQEQKTSDLRLGEILVNHGWVTPRNIEYMMKYVTVAKTDVESKTNIDSEVALLN